MLSTNRRWSGQRKAQAVMMGFNPYNPFRGQGTVYSVYDTLTMLLKY